MHEKLVSQQRGLKKQQNEMLRNIAQSQKVRQRLNQILEEAEVSAFQSFLLDFLGRRLRSEFQMEMVELEPIENDDESLDYVVRLRGKVNNESRRGHELVLDLQNEMKQEDRILEVNVDRSLPDGAWYSFEMTVFPNNVKA